MGIEGFLEEWCHSIIWFAVGWEWWWVSCWGGGFYGTFTLTRLVHVALFSIFFDLDVLSNSTRREVDKIFQAAFVDCLTSVETTRQYKAAW